MDIDTKFQSIKEKQIILIQYGLFVIFGLCKVVRNFPFKVLSVCLMLILIETISQHLEAFALNFVEVSCCIFAFH